jgi:hypothetical protein
MNYPAVHPGLFIFKISNLKSEAENLQRLNNV